MHGGSSTAWSVQLVALFCTLTGATQQWTSPSQTAMLAYAGATDGWSPKPTPAVSWPEILRRQEGPHSVCGYVGEVATDSVVCENAYCGFGTLSGTSVAGCWTATASSGRLTGCGFATTCYDFTECDASCSSANSKNFYYSCYASVNPYCGVLLYTDGALSFFCTTEQSRTFLAAYDTAAAGSDSQEPSTSTSQSSTSLLSSSSIPSSTQPGSVGSGVDSSSVTSPSPVPYTRSQMTGSSPSRSSATSTTTPSNEQNRLGPGLPAICVALLGLW